ncbi:acetate--CoA ligase family protein [Hoeflea poritis]|uniref:Acetate--CoA ligase family protein n=1 Tax=Hoeflea poritis TaxID=2993659 RepID=A0ABT4VV06_9HYPH|nr:acetate--CoA ligase family protein [Hoeflea poritis]MDA4848540.1 acetate--CoA ligase family protein [Hoeflea poritis]
MQNLDTYLWPKSVALIGASPEENNAKAGIRGRLTSVLLQHGYDGEIFLISRSNHEISGRKTYRSILEVPSDVDLAIIATPAQYVVDEVRNCATVGVKSILVVSSGFAESKEDGAAERQKAIERICRLNRINLAGPNCQGFVNTLNGLFATFAKPYDKPNYAIVPASGRSGRVAIISQSGGIGNGYFVHTRLKEMAASYILTTGNEAGVNLSELIEYVLDRGETSAILVLMEDIKDPQTFIRAADKALKMGVPIIVSKIGKSEAGQRAAESHTAALAGGYSGTQAVFRKYGIIEADDIGEMADIANGFCHFGNCLPAGNRVAILTGSGGGGGLMADAASGAGLVVPELDVETRRSLDRVIPDYGTSQNPVDATAQGLRLVRYSGLIERVMPSSEIDAVLFVASTRDTLTFELDAERLTEISAELQKPVLVWTYTVPFPHIQEMYGEVGLPLFTDLRNCTRTMREMADYHAFRTSYLSCPVEPSLPGCDKTSAASLLVGMSGALPEFQSRPILASYNICEAADLLVDSPESAAEAQASLDVPIALKVQSPSILHKSDAGALKLNIKGPGAAAKAYSDIVANAKKYDPDAKIAGVLVQPMMPDGVEMILGISRDETFGPMLMVGLGGIFVEILNDVAFAPVPLSRNEARRMLRRLKGFPLLSGARGTTHADLDALVEMMVRLAKLADDFRDHIAEIDLNPVIVHPMGEGVSVADAMLVVDGSFGMSKQDQHRTTHSAA